MIDIQFHEAAETELGEAATFYESRMAGLGNALVNEVQNAVQLLATYPATGVRLGKRLRKFALRRFPFSIIYRSETSRILVVAVAHNRRRPGYWKTRNS